MNKKNTLSKVKKVEVIEKAVKYLTALGITDGGDYVPIEFDGGTFLTGIIQTGNNGDPIINDLDAKVPNGTITRREQIADIIENAFSLSMVDEPIMPDLATAIADLYAMENGADHDNWEISVRQINAIPMSLYIEEMRITFDRSAKTVNISLSFVESDAVRYSFTAEANLETHAVNVTEPTSVVSVLSLNTWNDHTFEPEGDYNPATKKYVDDKIAPPIVWGATIHQLAGDNTTITIENLDNLNRKLNLGTASKQNIILNFKFTKPSAMPSITPGDLVEINVEGSLYVDASLSSVTTQYNFYEGGTLQDGSKYFFQNGEKPTLEAGHRYQIFISYYFNYNEQMQFATVGIVDFGTGSSSASAPAGN